MKIIQSNPIQSNPIQSNPILRKLCLSVAIATVAMVGQNAWACEKPQVSGYTSVGCLSEGLAYVITQDEKVGYVDGAGQLVIPATYKRLGVLEHNMNFSEGLAVVEKNNNEQVFIDKTGQIVLDDGYYMAFSFKNGLAVVDKRNKGQTAIDKTGKAVLNRYCSLASVRVRGSLANIKCGGVLYNYVVNTGKFYKDGGSFKESRIYVSDFNDKYGFLDETGREIIPLIYQYADDFSNGLARVKKDGKWGYIDTNGKAIIDFKYDWASNFENGKAKVEINDDKTPKYFYVDKTGKVLTTRTSLADFRKKLEQGDDVSFSDNGIKKAMIIEIKGNLVQVQTKERYPDNKWVKKSEVYPTNHFD